MAEDRKAASPASESEAREQAAARERQRPLTRELAELESDAEGTSGEGTRESGTLPGSVGGTTGTTGHSPGLQTPGSSGETLRGIDPAEARRRRKHQGRKGA